MIKTDIYNEKELRKYVIELALSKYGNPYVHGKQGPDEFDCAGFAWFVYKSLLDISIFYKGIGKSTTTKIMTGFYGNLRLYKEELLDKDINLIKEGDVLLFHTQSLDDDMPKEDNKYPGHCGIYLSDGQFIHATNRVGKVVVSSFEENEKWNRQLVASKDIIGDAKSLRKKINNISK